MRTLLCAVLTFTLTLPMGVAFAQSETEMKAGDDESEGLAPMEGDDEGESSVKAGGREEAPGASHTVERGDTLWDLSQRYLGSPWYWPKVWSYNPEIANPHWIYPGNVVRFFSTGEEVPTQVEVGEEPEQLPDVEEGSMYQDDKVHVAGKIGYVPKGSLSLPATAFITTREVEETGVIAGSFSEAELLAFPMTMYVEFREQRSARVGEQYVIFRNAGEVIHPVSLDHIGYMTKIVGMGKVIRFDKDSGMATLEITGQFEDILRGDLVGPMGEPIIVSTAARPNDVDITGAYVVTATSTFLTVFAEHSLIIVDKGADDGVKVGNTFTIWRQHDMQSQALLMNPTLIEDRWPREDVGTCMAFDVKAKTTTCVVVRAIRDLVRGDHVEMRSSRSRAASR